MALLINNLRRRVHARHHITWGDVILFKVMLSVAFVAIFFVPEPYATPLAMSTNLAWLWRL